MQCLCSFSTVVIPTQYIHHNCLPRTSCAASCRLGIAWFTLSFGFAGAEVVQLKHSVLVNAMSLVAAIGAHKQQPQGQPHVQPQGSGAALPTWPAGSNSQSVTQQYQLADSSAALQPSTSSHTARWHELEALAEAVMQQGCLDEEGTAVQAMMPYLPGFVRALSEVQGASRYGTKGSGHP